MRCWLSPFSIFHIISFEPTMMSVSYYLNEMEFDETKKDVGRMVDSCSCAVPESQSILNRKQPLFLSIQFYCSQRSARCNFANRQISVLMELDERKKFGHLLFSLGNFKTRRSHQNLEQGRSGQSHILTLQSEDIVFISLVMSRCGSTLCR